MSKKCSSLGEKGELSAERERDIQGLHTETKALLRCKQRDTYGYVKMRNEPETKIKPRDTFIESVPVTVYMGGALLKEDAAKILVLAIGNMYHDYGDDKIDSRYFYSSLMTMLSVFTSPNIVSESNIVAALPNYSLKFDVKNLDTPAEIDAYYQERGGPAILEQMGFSDLEDDADSLIVIAFSMMILIGKRLITNSIDQWFRSRWRAITAILAANCDETSLQIPQLENCVKLYTFMAAHPKIRAAVFVTYRDISKKPGKYQMVFNRIVRLLAWTEMSHIGMILEYIIYKYPEVTLFSEFGRCEKTAMQVALEFMDTFEAEDRPFLRILRDQSELEPLNAIHFKQLTAAAHAIGARINPSMKNINMGNNDAIKAFQERVIKFLDLRQIMDFRIAGQQAYGDKTDNAKFFIEEVLAMRSGDDPSSVACPDRI